MPSITNGQLPAEMLGSIGGGRRMRLDAAASWMRLCAAVRARFGWTPTLSDGASAYRTYDEQVALFTSRYVVSLNPLNRGPYGDVRWWKGKRYVRTSPHGAAAIPGTSNHGSGLAGDVADLGGFEGKRYREFASVAPEHGWSNTEGRSIGEAWHWVHAPEQDKHVPTSTGKHAAPAPVHQEEEDDEVILLARTKDDPRVFAGNGIIRTHVPNPQALADLQFKIRTGVLKGDPELQYVDRIEWLGKEL